MSVRQKWQTKKQNEHSKSLACLMFHSPRENNLIVAFLMCSKLQWRFLIYHILRRVELVLFSFFSFPPPLFPVVFIYVTPGFGQCSTVGKYNFSTSNLCKKIFSPFPMKGNGIQRQPCCLVIPFWIAYWHNMAVNCNIFSTWLFAPCKRI